MSDCAHLTFLKSLILPLGHIIPQFVALYFILAMPVIFSCMYSIFETG